MLQMESAIELLANASVLRRNPELTALSIAALHPHLPRTVLDTEFATMVLARVCHLGKEAHVKSSVTTAAAMGNSTLKAFANAQPDLKVQIVPASHVHWEPTERNVRHMEAATENLANAPASAAMLVSTARRSCVQLNAHPTANARRGCACVTKAGQERTALSKRAHLTALLTVSVSTEFATASLGSVEKIARLPNVWDHRFHVLVEAHASKLEQQNNQNVSATMVSPVSIVRLSLPFTRSESLRPREDQFQNFLDVHSPLNIWTKFTLIALLIGPQTKIKDAHGAAPRPTTLANGDIVHRREFVAVLTELSATVMVDAPTILSTESVECANARKDGKMSIVRNHTVE